MADVKLAVEVEPMSESIKYGYRKEKALYEKQQAMLNRQFLERQKWSNYCFSTNMLRAHAGTKMSTCHLRTHTSVTSAYSYNDLDTMG